MNDEKKSLPPVPNVHLLLAPILSFVQEVDPGSLVDEKKEALLALRLLLAMFQEHPEPPTERCIGPVPRDILKYFSPPCVGPWQIDDPPNLSELE